MNIFGDEDIKENAKNVAICLNCGDIKLQKCSLFAKTNKDANAISCRRLTYVYRDIYWVMDSLSYHSGLCRLIKNYRGKFKLENSLRPTFFLTCPSCLELRKKGVKMCLK